MGRLQSDTTNLQFSTTSSWTTSHSFDSQGFRCLEKRITASKVKVNKLGTPADPKSHINRSSTGAHPSLNMFILSKKHFQNIYRQTNKTYTIHNYCVRYSSNAFGIQITHSSRVGVFFRSPTRTSIVICRV